MPENGLENYFIIKNNKKMKYGYTTGSCGAAAAKAAAIMLFSGQSIQTVDLMTPKEILLHLRIEDISMAEGEVSCAVRKAAGDDPDVTNGVLVYAKVRKTPEPGIFIDGGIGVGRVTKPGLEQPVGAAAINRVPRQMITEAVRGICEENDYAGGIEVEISIPEGVDIAKKTFNPRLGIEGGISVLGTSGIVEPMSETALVASIEVEIKMRAAQGAVYLVIAPGNYGTKYLGEHFPFDLEKAVKCSNYVGETIDIAHGIGIKGILFVSHIGKFVKVAGGIMNTHSREADCRMELLAAHALASGVDAEQVKQLLNCVTTDDALEVLAKKDQISTVMERIMERIYFYLNHRAYDEMEIGAIVFSNVYGELGRTKNADHLIEKILQEQRNMHDF